MVSCVSYKELKLVEENAQQATLTYAYEYVRFEKISVDFQKTQIEANEKCKEWGYDNAKFINTYFKRIDSVTYRYQIILESNCIRFEN